MNPSLQMRLAQSRAGRIALHLVALPVHRNLRFAGKGIGRELSEAIKAYSIHLDAVRARRDASPPCRCADCRERTW